MNQSQLRQPLNVPSNSNLAMDFSLGGQRSNSEMNHQIPSANNNKNLNDQHIPPMHTIPPQAQVNNIAYQQKNNMNQFNAQNINQKNNANPAAAAPSQTNWPLTIIYTLVCLLSLAGFLASMITMILAGDVASISQFLEFSPKFSVSLNFIIIYNPFSGLVFFISIYLIYLSYKYYGKVINYSQIATLSFSVLAFVFGTVNYAQIGSDTLSQSCSDSSKQCKFYNAFKAYQQMVIPISLIPMLFLACAQYLLYRLKTAPPPAPPQQVNQQKQAYELQQSAAPKPNQSDINNNKPPLNMPSDARFPQQQPIKNPNNMVGQVINESKPNGQNFKPQVNIPTDPKLTGGDIRLNSRGSQISENGNFQMMNNNNLNQGFGNMNPVVQKPNNLNGIPPVVVANNLANQMNQQQNRLNQFQLGEKEISTPKEQNFNGIIGQNQIALDNMGSMLKQSSTPTPNLGSLSNQKLNGMGFENASDIHNMKTTISQFTNTPLKSPTKKGLSPIDRALSNNQRIGNDNINEIVQNNDYNPYGNLESGEIQLGKHPYILGAKDPYVGQILDQVQAMVNNQVKSLLLDLKKQNKV